MEVMYFSREENVHIDCRNSSNSSGTINTGIYVPDNDIILCTEAYGASPGSGPVITDNKELLDELRILNRGQLPDKDGVRYTHKKKVDLDENKTKKLNELIEKAKKFGELTPKYNSLYKDINSGYREFVIEINK